MKREWCKGSGMAAKALRKNKNRDKCPVCNAVFVRYKTDKLPLHKDGQGDFAK